MFFDLEGKLAVVIGDGDGARARIDALRAVGARVRAVSEHPHRDISALALAGEIELRPRGYALGDLLGAAIAIAVADRATNDAVRLEADLTGVPLGVVDNATLSDWIHGAVVRRGALVVAISTSGVAPALAVRLKEKLERQLGDEYPRFLELAAEHRGRIGASGLSFAERRAIWYRLVDEALAALREGDEARAREMFLRALEDTPVEVGA